MSMHNKKTARLLQGVVLGLIIIATILFAGCENPVGGAENNPLADFAGKTYKSEYGELFSVTTNTVKLGFRDSYNTEGKIVGSRTTPEGTVYLLECSNHINAVGYQYPNYDEHDSHQCIKDSYGNCSVPHKDCYTLVHVRSSSTQSVEWTTFYTSVDTKQTACFDSNSLFKAKEYLDFSKWDEPYSYSTGIAQN